jgi:hypothetical protein
MSQLPDQADPAAGPLERPPATTPLKSWHDTRDWSASLLRARTGQDVAAWNRRIAESGIDAEPALRARPGRQEGDLRSGGLRE